MPPLGRVSQMAKSSPEARCLQVTPDSPGHELVSCGKVVEDPPLRRVALEEPVRHAIPRFLSVMCAGSVTELSLAVTRDQLSKDGTSPG
jgi:hypothetical protein